MCSSQICPPVYFVVLSDQVDRMTSPNNYNNGDDDFVVSQSPAGQKGVCSHNDDGDHRGYDVVILPYQQNV